MLAWHRVHRLLLKCSVQLMIDLPRAVLISACVTRIQFTNFLDGRHSSFNGHRLKLFFDGLHDHLTSCAPAAGIQLRFGKWVSFLVYADDVVLLSWSASGLQLLLDSMNHGWMGMGLLISPTKTEVVVFIGPGTASTRRIGAQSLAQSTSFKYLGLIFHESGTMSYALQRLAHNAVGACAQLRAKFKGLLCQQSFPMMRRFFDALGLPTVSYGSEV